MHKALDSDLAHAFFRQGPGHMGVLDPKGRVQLCSHAALEGFGIDPEAFRGTLWWNGPWWADDADGRAAARDLFHIAAHDGQASGLLRYQSGGGESQWRQAHLSTQRRDGKALSVYVNCTDISSQMATARMRDRALQQSREQLREVNHRVMNTLTIVASLIRQEMRRSETQEARDALRRLGHRLSAITGLYRTLTRTSASDGHVDARAYLEGVIGDIRAALLPQSVTRVHIATRIATVQIPFQVATSLGLIVNELMTNAIKYAFPDGRAGVLRILLEPDEGGLLLRVTDDGSYEGSADDPAPSGVGGQLIAAFAQQLDGSVRHLTPIGGGYGIEVRIGAEALLHG